MSIMDDKEKKRLRKKKKNDKDIVDLNTAAKELGMSYGQYVAMQYQKTMKSAPHRINQAL